MEYKASKAFTMGIDGRTVTGIFCVHGNVDEGDGWSTRDRSHPGLFGDFSVDGRKRAVFLWQHNSYEPPTATIDQLFEVARADLPPAVLKYAPDATGGTAVKRTYLETTRANEVLAALSAGALSEMSYAYDPTRWDFEKGPSDSDIRIRNLYEADLYDVSDVNWGMNPATSADGTKGQNWKAQPLTAHAGAVEAAIAELAARLVDLKQRRLKEGRTFSAANYSALTTIADSLETLSVDLRSVLDKAEPKTATDTRRLLLDYERTLATLNGVQL
jgi:Caudovirus prohead serine protease